MHIDKDIHSPALCRHELAGIADQVRQALSYPAWIPNDQGGYVARYEDLHIQTLQLRDASELMHARRDQRVKVERHRLCAHCTGRNLVHVQDVSEDAAHLPA